MECEDSQPSRIDEKWGKPSVSQISTVSRDTLHPDSDAHAMLWRPVQVHHDYLVRGCLSILMVLMISVQSWRFMSRGPPQTRPLHSHVNELHDVLPRTW